MTLMKSKRDWKDEPATASLCSVCNQPFNGHKFRVVCRVCAAPTRAECSQHPDAPHGFDRDASAAYGRYICTCEFWAPPLIHKRDMPIVWLLAGIAGMAGIALLWASLV